MAHNHTNKTSTGGKNKKLTGNPTTSTQILHHSKQHKQRLSYTPQDTATNQQKKTSRHSKPEVLSQTKMPRSMQLSDLDVNKPRRRPVTHVVTRKEASDEWTKFPNTRHISRARNHNTVVADRKSNKKQKLQPRCKRRRSVQRPQTTAPPTHVI